MPEDATTVIIDGEVDVEEKVIELRPGASSSSNGDGGADD